MVVLNLLLLTVSGICAGKYAKMQDKPRLGSFQAGIF